MSVSQAIPAARHIMTYAQSLNGGGVERAMLALVRGWVAAGRRVTLVIGRSAGPLAAELPQGAELIELGSSRFTALRVLAHHVRAARPDVIFCPGNHYSSIAVLTRLRLGQAAPPIVAKVSNALVRADHGPAMAAAYRFWLRRHPRHIDHLVAMTAAMRVEALAEMRAAPEQVSVIADPLAPNRADSAPDLAVPPGRFILGVGRLEPQKRWDRLIDALPGLADPAARLVILGEGSERAGLEARIAALGLGERVALPGYAANPGPMLAAAAVCVLTSDFEGVPGVLREALAVGTPVVTTDSSVAVREIVAHPDWGDVVAREDRAALIAALDRWLAPDARRPAPVAPEGDDSAARYLCLFDRLVAERRQSRAV